jgi:hypothetical protein
VHFILQVSSALDVIFFVREICETHPSLRPSILERLRDTFSTIRASRVVSIPGCVRVCVCVWGGVIRAQG